MILPFEQCPHLTTDSSLSNLFDFSYAPPLLFYSYIPILFLSLIFGTYILYKEKFSSVSKHLFTFTLFFAAYTLLSLFQWIGVYAEIIQFSWQIYLIAEVGIFLLSIPFAFSFLFNKPFPFLYTKIISAIFIILAFIVPTRLNVDSFDPVNCEGITGVIWPYVYIFELACLAIIFWLAIKKIRQKVKQDQVRPAVFSFGLVTSLSIFWISNYFGELTNTYEINLAGPVGMFLFISLLAYMIIKFKIFNVKIFSSQLLVVSLWFLIGALLFIQNIEYIRIVVIFTLGLVVLLGFSLIRSVKKEIEQREKVEKLATQLEEANLHLKELDRQKDELLSIVSHQLAAPVTSLKWYLELLHDGDLGVLQKEQQESISTMTGVTTNLADLVSMILDVSRIQLGRMKIDSRPLNLNEFFKEILDVITPKAKEKKIDFVIQVPADLPTVLLDKRYTRMTIENLLTNAIKYTPKGGKVALSVKKKGAKLSCSVKDTGVGIPKNEQDKIFGKMFRASNVRNSVDGNGFGLYVAKGAIEAQGGKIWFTSEEGKGATFFVELPLVGEKK